MMNRLLILATALALGACASSTGSGPSETRGKPASIIRTGDGYHITPSSNESDPLYTLAASPDQVWSALIQTYIALDVPMGTINTDEHILGNQQLSVQGRFAGERASEFLNCGFGTLGTPNSNTYRIQLSLLTALEPAADGGTQLVTRVDARGTSNEGVSTAAVRCRSTGALEERIANMVRERVDS